MNRSRWIITAVACAVACLVVAWCGPGDARTARRAAPAFPESDRLREPAPAREPATSPDRAFALEVRDLADGEPVTGLELTCRLADGARVSARTDDRGRLVLAAPCRTATATRGDWRVVSRGPGDAEDVFWAWRPVRVRGTVRGTDATRELAMDAVELSGRYGGPPADGGQPTDPPWLWTWLQERDAPIRVALGKPRADGTFDVEMPRIGGYGIRARAPGWETAWEVPAVDSLTAETTVSLALRPAVRVRGIARGADGRPLEGVMVRAFVVRRGTYTDFSAGHLFVELEEGFTGEWDDKRDRARVTAIHQVFTGDAGEFELELKTRGDVWLVAHASEHAPLDRHLGTLDADPSDLALTLQPSQDVGRVRLLNDGAPVANRLFLLADMTVRDTQPAVRLRTDDEGYAATEWLERGRLYGLGAVGAEPVFRGLFVWTGQDTLDFTRMTTRLRDH